jgi:hypothetical protein
VGFLKEWCIYLNIRCDFFSQFTIWQMEVALYSCTKFNTLCEGIFLKNEDLEGGWGSSYMQVVLYFVKYDSVNSSEPLNICQVYAPLFSK